MSKACGGQILVRTKSPCHFSPYHAASSGRQWEERGAPGRFLDTLYTPISLTAKMTHWYKMQPDWPTGEQILSLTGFISFARRKDNGEAEREKSLPRLPGPLWKFSLFWERHQK